MALSKENQDLAAQILSALSTSGNPNVPEVGPLGEPPPADAPASAHERFEKARDARHLHLMNIPSGKMTPAERQELMQASLTALGIKF